MTMGQCKHFVHNTRLKREIHFINNITWKKFNSEDKFEFRSYKSCMIVLEIQITYISFIIFCM